jgi:peptidoglycan/xylan/chitin deacetylase (PgdA/CDA1 family)
MGGSNVTLILIACVVVLLAAFAAWALIRPSDWLLARLSSLEPGVVYRIDTVERLIALTIDDAPHPEVTPEILRVLREYRTLATFFVIGSHAEAHRELVESIRSDGHELANHLFTDRISASLSDEEFVEELQRTDGLIQPLGSPRWCRPGSGVITKRIARIMRMNGYTPVAATAYPLDLRTSVDLTARQFLENVRPGAVLVLHDGRPDRKRTVEVLERVLPRLEEMGYRATTLGELEKVVRNRTVLAARLEQDGAAESPNGPGAQKRPGSCKPGRSSV